MFDEHRLTQEGGKLIYRLYCRVWDARVSWSELWRRSAPSRGKFGWGWPTMRITYPRVGGNDVIRRGFHRHFLDGEGIAQNILKRINICPYSGSFFLGCFRVGSRTWALFQFSICGRAAIHFMVKVVSPRNRAANASFSGSRVCHHSQSTTVHPRRPGLSRGNCPAALAAKTWLDSGPQRGYLLHHENSRGNQ